MKDFDIHCPECGNFLAEKNAKKGCPKCGNKQAISLHRRWDIEARFSQEKINATKDNKW